MVYAGSFDGIYRTKLSELPTSSEDNDKAICQNPNIVSPNPASDILYFNRDHRKLDIYDINGNIVLSSENILSRIDISSLRPGFYFISAYQEGKKSGMFFIKK
jgi:hypothetical protein